MCKCLVTEFGQWICVIEVVDVYYIYFQQINRWT